ncbi:MAG TPA: glycosyltransferase family 4 protein [Bacteroidota bacterium]|nr:glycosyltransferase family 4 protein [Bacteroidota bacterium]
MLKRATMVVADSASALDDIYRVAGSLHNLVMIPHGTRLDAFRPRQKSQEFLRKHGLRLESQDKVCLYNGGFFAHKGIQYLTEAILRSPGLGVQFVLVGYGPDLKQYAGDLKSADNVTIIPLVPPSEVPDFYSIGDIYILPSIRTELDAERSPNTLIEAMASGLACIATSVGGIPTYAGNATLMIPEKDSGAIVRALELLVKDPDLLRRKGRDAREFAESDFDIDRYAQRLCALVA